MGVFSLPAGVVRWLVSLGALKERVDLGVAEQDQLVPLSQRAKQHLIDGTLVAEAVAAALERAGETPAAALRQAAGSGRGPVDRWRAVAEALSEHVDVVLDEDICQDLTAASDESLAAELLLEVYTVLRAYHQQKKKKRPSRRPEKREGYAATSQRRDRSPVADSREQQPSRRDSPSREEKTVLPAEQKTSNLIEKPKSAASSPRSRKMSPRVEDIPSPVTNSSPVSRPIVSPKQNEREGKKIKSPRTMPVSAKTVKDEKMEEDKTPAVSASTFLTIDEPSAIASPILPMGSVHEVDAETSLLALPDHLGTAALDPPWKVVLSTALETLQVARPGTLDRSQVERMVLEGELYPFTTSSLVKWYTSVLHHHIEDLPLSVVCKVALPTLNSTVYGLDASKAAGGLLYLAASRGRREDNSLSGLVQEGYIDALVEAIRAGDDSDDTRSSLCSALFQIWHRDGASLVTLFTGHLGRTHPEIMPVAHSLVATLSQHGEPFMALSPVVDLLVDQLVRKRRCCCAGCAALLGELWCSGLMAAKTNYTQLAEEVLLVLQERASEPTDEDQHIPYVSASTLVSILDYVCRQEDETMAPAVWRSLVFSVIVALGCPEAADFSTFISALVAEALSRLPCLPVCMVAEPVCKLVHERHDEETMTDSELALLLAVARHPRLTESVGVEMLSLACNQMVSAAGSPGIDSTDKRIVKTIARRYADNKAFASEAADGCLRQILPSLLKGPGSADAVVAIVCIMSRAGGRRLGPDEDHLRSVTRQLVADLCTAYRSVYAALHPNLLRASRAFPELEDAFTTPDPHTDASESRSDHVRPVATLLPFGSGPTGMLGTGPLDSFRSRTTGRIRELEIQMGAMAEKHKEREDSLESIIRDLESKMGTVVEQEANRELPMVPKLPLSSKSSPRRLKDQDSSVVASVARSPRAPTSPPPKHRGKHAGRKVRRISGSEGEERLQRVAISSSVRQKGVVLVLEGAVADECSKLVKAFAKPLEVIYLQ